MSAGTLLLGAAVELAAAGLFARVAIVTLRRPVSAAGRGALIAFAAWWFGASSVLAIGGAATLLGLAGVLDPTVHFALLILRALPLSGGVLGLVYYLVYLYTGSRRALTPLVALYAAHFAFTLYYFLSLAPIHVETTAWEIRAAGASPPGAGLDVAFGIALALPILGATAAYATLLTRLDDRTQRYRVATVSIAFAQWFLFILLGFVAGFTTRDWFFLVYTGPGLVAAALVLGAYEPPAFLRERLSVDPVPRRESA